MKGFKLLLKHASELISIPKTGKYYLKGSKMNSLYPIQDGCLCVGWDGRLTHVGTTKKVLSFVNEKNVKTIVDCRKKQTVIPGLIDAHTHLVWNGDRCFEFALKLEGATYMDIHKKGGGIAYTVKQVQQAKENVLAYLLRQRLNRMVQLGTTLAETKSGYGLIWQSENKILKIIEYMKREHILDLVSTYLGPHSIPQGKNANDATRDIVKNQIPKLKNSCLTGSLSVEFIDIFNEKGVFETENTQQIMTCCSKHRFHLNIHGDELNSNGSAELSTKMGAKAISHLEHISEKGQQMMFKFGVVAVLLPTTAHLLRIKQPPAKRMINNDVIVSLATDFNPNAFCLSMPFVMNLSCISMHLTMNEALVASTLNAAASINRSSTHGSLEVSKHANFIIIDNPNWKHLIYEMACSPIQSVYKNGKCIHTK